MFNNPYSIKSTYIVDNFPTWFGQKLHILRLNCFWEFPFVPKYWPTKKVGAVLIQNMGLRIHLWTEDEYFRSETGKACQVLTLAVYWKNMYTQTKSISPRGLCLPMDQQRHRRRSEDISFMAKIDNLLMAIVVRHISAFPNVIRRDSCNVSNTVDCTELQYNNCSIIIIVLSSSSQETKASSLLNIST